MSPKKRERVIVWMRKEAKNFAEKTFAQAAVGCKDYWKPTSLKEHLQALHDLINSFEKMKGSRSISSGYFWVGMEQWGKEWHPSMRFVYDTTNFSIKSDSGN